MTGFKATIFGLSILVLAGVAGHDEVGVYQLTLALAAIVAAIWATGGVKNG